MPTLAFVAAANAVRYCGACPVFVDSEPDTWTIDPGLLEERISERTRDVIAVHLYGQPADMGAIVAVARRHGLFVVEDAAEAHGAEYRGRRVGSIGDAAIFSFYGNKILTAGEGGMVVTDDEAVAEKVRILRGQGMDPDHRYWFPVVGYNYRMTNVAAAIGVAQLEKADWHMRRRLEVASWYREWLRRVPGVVWQAERAWARHAYWMVTVVLGEEARIGRDDVMGSLARWGIETRPVFYPIHALPPYRQDGSRSFPVAERIARGGITLPTWAGLTAEDVSYICDTLAGCVGG